MLHNFDIDLLTQVTNLRTSINYGDYALYIQYSTSAPEDMVSETPLNTDNLDVTRYGYDGESFGVGEAVIEADGLLTGGAYDCMGVYSEDDTEWSGAGPWTLTISLAELTTYTLSTEVPGATVVVTAGTATLTAL